MIQTKLNYRKLPNHENWKENARVAFEVLTRKKYFDYLPLARRTRKAILKNIQERRLTYGA
jgi:hypothetical protein